MTVAGTRRLDLAVLPVDFKNLIHIVGGTDDEGRALMDGGRHLFENAHSAVRSLASGLFGKEGHGRGFVHQAQLAVRMLEVLGVEEDAALEQGAMEVGDERTHVAGGTGRHAFGTGEA